MGGVNSNQTLVPEVYAMLWNTNGIFQNWLQPKNSWEVFGKKKRRKRRDLKRYRVEEWLKVINGDNDINGHHNDLNGDYNDMYSAYNDYTEYIDDMYNPTDYMTAQYATDQKTSKYATNQYNNYDTYDKAYDYDQNGYPIPKTMPWKLWHQKLTSTTTTTQAPTTTTSTASKTYYYEKTLPLEVFGLKDESDVKEREDSGFIGLLGVILGKLLAAREKDEDDIKSKKLTTPITTTTTTTPRPTYGPQLRIAKEEDGDESTALFTMLPLGVLGLGLAGWSFVATKIRKDQGSLNRERRSVNMDGLLKLNSAIELCNQKYERCQQELTWSNSDPSSKWHHQTRQKYCSERRRTCIKSILN